MTKRRDDFNWSRADAERKAKAQARHRAVRPIDRVLEAHRREPTITARPRVRSAAGSAQDTERPSPLVDVATFNAIAIATRDGKLVAVGVFVHGGQEGLVEFVGGRHPGEQLPAYRRRTPWE